jgi:hypothetical protein
MTLYFDDSSDTDLEKSSSSDSLEVISESSESQLSCYDS